MTDPAASSELSQQYYREGFELLKLEHFVESLEKFGKSAELQQDHTRYVSQPGLVPISLS